VAAPGTRQSSFNRGQKPADFILSADADADLYESASPRWRSGEKQSPPEYLDSVFAAFAALALQPELGPARPELGEFVRVLTVGQHLIFYEPHLRGIEVLRVLHQSVRSKPRCEVAGRGAEAPVQVLSSLRASGAVRFQRRGWDSPNEHTRQRGCLIAKSRCGSPIERSEAQLIGVPSGI
jgi:plasmid stabilization system protein ParE